MTTSVIFNFQSQEIRTFTRDGEPWFVAADVAQALDYRDAHNLTRILEAYEKDTHIVSTPGNNQEMTIINESGLYSAILKSRKPEAKAFKRWVTCEVLPTIRKTGGYRAPKTRKTSPGGLTLEQIETVKALHRELVKAAPKEQQARIAITLWSAVKSKFGVSYKDVPSEHYAEILSLMSRVAIDGELLPPTKSQEPETPEYIVMLPIDTRHNTRFEIEVLNGLVARYYPQRVAHAEDYGKPWGTLLKARW